MDEYSSFTPMAAGLGILIFLIYLVLLGISIYMFILYVKLAHRGIKALDIYISKNNKPLYPPPNFNNANYYGGQNTGNPNQQPATKEES